MEGIFLTTIGMLKKIDHESYKFFKWNYMGNVFNIFTKFWSTVQTHPYNEVIKTMKDIAQFIEMDGLTWRTLMRMFHDGDQDRLRAKLRLWDIFMKAAIAEDVNIFKSTSAINCKNINEEDIKNCLRTEWNPEHIEMPPEVILVQTPDGVKIMSATVIIKEHQKEWSSRDWDH